VAGDRVLQEHVCITVLREPSGCLTFQQLVDRLHAEPSWRNIQPNDLRGALSELLHEPGPRIEQREDGCYCRRDPDA
jgi:hypothetical protein